MALIIKRTKQIFLALFLAVFVLPWVYLLVVRLAPPPITPLMVIRLFEGEGLSKDWQPADAISPHLKWSVIASEDNKFCQHFGFDWEAMQKAWDDHQRRNKRLRGASTISQQTAKNLFLWPGGSFVRKGLEAYYTLALELILPKSRIATLYLNIAEWGPGIYGAEAAAKYYFGKTAAGLTPREAAALAAILPNPRKFSAAKPSYYIVRRTQTIQRRAPAMEPLAQCILG